MANFDEPTANDQAMQPASPVALDLLMQVEVPVRVSLGRTQMRMKELLGLTHGSVVELDKGVSDEVEILVNSWVIAHGELVAVDGNYGVRVTRMAADPNPTGRAPEGVSPGGNLRPPVE